MGLVLALSVVGWFASYHQAQGQDLSKYQALFITKFMDYVNWPVPKAQLVVGIMGNSKVLGEAKQFLERKGKNAVVKKLSGVENASNCDIIFLPKEQKKLFNSLNTETAGKSILIVTEVEELAAQGSVITFYVESNKLKFIINKQAADQRRLKISSSLMNIGKVI